MQTTLRAIADRLELLTLLHRYFTCLDARDLAGLRDLLVPEVRAEHSLLGVLHGREAFLGVVARQFPGLVTAQHYCSNELVQVRGDEAECQAYLFAQHLVERRGEQLLLPGGGRYSLQCVRQDDVWRIRSIRNEVTWMAPGLAEVFVPGS